LSAVTALAVVLAQNSPLEAECPWVRAENNGDHFGKNLFPIPQAERPDF